MVKATRPHEHLLQSRHCAKHDVHVTSLHAQNNPRGEELSLCSFLQMRWLTQNDAREFIRLPPGTRSPPRRCGHTASWLPCFPRSRCSSHMLSEPSAALSALQERKPWSSPGRGLPALLGPSGLCESSKDAREEASEKTAVRGSRKPWTPGSQ